MNMTRPETTKETSGDAARLKKAECLSMTGFAQARIERNGWALRVSVKSVNHRFLDLKLRMPEGFDLYDLRLRQILRERIHRGHVEVNLNVEPAAAAPLQVNRELLQAYLRAAEELRKETRAAADVDVVGLLRLPGVIGGLDGAGELGKKLDFLLQEMHREANTLLSKTPGVESEALAITGLALEIKAEIEKLREQVQNIE